MMLALARLAIVLVFAAVVCGGCELILHPNIFMWP